GTAQCVGGATCQIQCNSGYHLCNGDCFSDTDPNHCTGACTPCPGAANATATCNGTGCSYRCNQGFAGCDLPSANGCEATVSTNIIACCACGAAGLCPHTTLGTTYCAPGQNGIGTCAIAFESREFARGPDGRVQVGILDASNQILVSVQDPVFSNRWVPWD